MEVEKENANKDCSFVWGKTGIEFENQLIKLFKITCKQIEIRGLEFFVSMPNVIPIIDNYLWVELA